MTPIKQTSAQYKRLARNVEKATKGVPVKKPKTIIKELRQELHYWQILVNVEARSLKATIEKCKQIGAQMRELQKRS